METIESKIKGERYNVEEELISDFKLMFHNCQRYNEEGSVIHTDATTLERVRHDVCVCLGEMVSIGVVVGRYVDEDSCECLVAGIMI